LHLVFPSPQRTEGAITALF